MGATARKVRLPSLRACELALQEPASAWVARCFEIASRIVEARLTPPGSVAVYGHWIGPVAKGSHFEGRAALPFVNHGWVLLPDGNVLDPTRWVFENVEPYLYVGVADHYDEGGNRFREATQPSRAPAFDPDDEVYELTKLVLPEAAAWNFIEKTLGLLEAAADDPDYQIGTVTKTQLRWLAHRDPRSLGDHAYAIYVALKTLDLGAHIPIDNLRMVERMSGKKVEKRP